MDSWILLTNNCLIFSTRKKPDPGKSNETSISFNINLQQCSYLPQVIQMMLGLPIVEVDDLGDIISGPCQPTLGW